MTPTRRNALRLLVAAPLVAAGCTARGPAPAGDDDAAALEAAILALGPGIDASEAARAAQRAYAHTATLAQAYEITDPPLIHNTKVNAGLKPRGLCWHWAEDMQKMLDRESFETLATHRAIANADNPFRLDHSTAILSRRGAGFEDGIVLDPWRRGGRLFWAPVAADARYDWQSREAVLARMYPREA